MTTVTAADIARYVQTGSWRSLEQLAAAMAKDAEMRAGTAFRPHLGGGTRLMLSLEHRISHDIDLFIRDPQWIGYLTPRLNSGFEREVLDYEEASTSLKLRRPEGEIDFIVSMSLLGLPSETVPHTIFPVEPLAEVLAKKLFYRGWALTARDLFDWWAVETRKPAEIPQREIAALLKQKHAAIENALSAMLMSVRAAETWQALLAPDKPEFKQTVEWARRRLQEYVALGQPG